MNILPDLLDYNLNVVFCGTAVGNRSAQVKAYYAGQGNTFYETLCRIGLTDKVINPIDYPKLLEYKIGLTDLVKTVSGNDSKLSSEDFDVEYFKNQILKYKPKLVCFNGKEAARVYLGLKSTKYVNYGIQKERIGNSLISVLLSTSGSARGYWDENVWKKINSYLR